MKLIRIKYIVAGIVAAAVVVGLFVFSNLSCASPQIKNNVIDNNKKALAVVDDAKSGIKNLDIPKEQKSIITNALDKCGESLTDSINKITQIELYTEADKQIISDLKKDLSRYQKRVSDDNIAIIIGSIILALIIAYKIFIWLNPTANLLNQIKDAINKK